MKINPKKTKTMTVSKVQTTGLSNNIELGIETLEEVEKYAYLGADITNGARCLSEVKKRIAIAKTAFWKQKEILRRNINVKTKLRILNNYIYSILTYASESWTNEKSLSNRIKASENWCYRRILRVSWIEKVTNKEILRRIGKRDFDLKAWKNVIKNI
jgi:hypothetical protein